MNIPILSAASLLFVLFGAIAPAAGAPPESGLVPTRAMDFDEALGRPGVDFRSYTKILLDPAKVSFDKNWLGDVNRRGTTLSGRVTQGDRQAIVEAARIAFDASWKEAFRTAGYEIVDSPGEGVLRLSPRVVDFYVNAPYVMTTGIARNYVEEAGMATLLLEIRDSRTGTVLGQVRDRRETTTSPVPMRIEAGTNEREFGRLFARWADIATHGLVHLSSR